MSWVTSTIGNVERLPQACQFQFQFFARDLIDGGERLVHQQHARIAGQGAGERHALSLAAGQRVGAARFEAVEIDPAEQRAGADALVRLAAGLHGDGDGIERGEMREQRVILEHEADRAPLRRQPDAVMRIQPRLAADGDATLGRHQEPGDGAQHRRLAAARRTDERHELARPARQRHVHGDRRALHEADFERSGEMTVTIVPHRGPLRRRAVRCTMATATNETSSSTAAMAPASALRNACTRS